MNAPEVAIVGSGPNGLAAGVVLARAGLSVAIYEAAMQAGGGLRSDLPFDSRVRHDRCSAVHPMAVASPFFRAFDLPARGVALRAPSAAFAHPLDGAPAGIAYRDLAATCDRLGEDGPRWRALLEPLVRRSTALVDYLMSDLRGLPPDPLALLPLPSRVLRHGTALARAQFTGRQAPALLAGAHAHALGPLPRPVAAGTGLLLAHLAHAGGWPIPEGGSQAIADALIADFQAHGGKLHTGTPVMDLRELRTARAVLLDLAPKGLLDLAGSLLPSGYRRLLGAFRYGPAAAKVDFLVSEPIPWRDPEIGRAGTVHLGGDQAEVFRTETLVAKGIPHDEPFVLLSEPMVADPGRGLPGKRPVWAYAHVPVGDRRDPTELITRRIERYAPGFTDTVLASRALSARDLEEYNPNYVGGDIGAGAVSAWQVLARPVPRWNPYRTPLAGVYLCSASTPPGPGVHGMAGMLAARHVLRREFGIRELPELRVAPR